MIKLNPIPWALVTGLILAGILAFYLPYIPFLGFPKTWYPVAYAMSLLFVTLIFLIVFALLLGLGILFESVKDSYTKAKTRVGPAPVKIPKPKKVKPPKKIPPNHVHMRP